MLYHRKLPFDDTHAELASDDANTSAAETSMLALKTEKSSPAREEKLADITITVSYVLLLHLLLSNIQSHHSNNRQLCES